MMNSSLSSSFKFSFLANDAMESKTTNETFSDKTMVSKLSIMLNNSSQVLGRLTW